MIRLLRIRVWSLMVVAALVALAFTVAFEIMNRFQRDRLLRLQLRNYETTLGSRKHALECSAAVKAGRPYSTASRLKPLSGDPRVPQGGFRFWEDEWQFHCDWGFRSDDEALMWDRAAKAVERKFLAP